MKFALHTFQKDILNELRQGHAKGHRRQLCGLATGGGKTVVASHAIHSAAQKGRTSLFIVDRIELVGQAARTLTEIGLQVGVLQGDNTRLHPDDECIVASIQTIRAREAPPAGFVVIDEAHILHRAHVDLMRRWDRVPFIGLSATPLRPDLGQHFSNLVRGPTVAWLTENGFLTPVKAYCPMQEKIDAALESVKVRAGDFVESELSEAFRRKELVGDVISEWKARASDRPTLVFAVDIAHSKAIIGDFLDEGIAAQHLDAYTKPEERRDIIARFKAGEIRVLSSVNVLGIGFDYPGASCGILARPTLSEALHMQQLGRVIRTAPGKQDAIILDHAGNTIRFGLPEHFVIPDLGQGEHQSAKTKRKQKTMATCKSCHAVIEPGSETCPHCGIDRPLRSADVVYIDGRLGEYGKPTTGTEDQADRRSWYQAFLWEAESRGIKRGWAFFAFQAKFNAKPAWSWQNLPPLEPTWEQSRWIRHHRIKQAKAFRAAS
ncbi:DEAD/DEAH box helicase family protein [Thiorhodovibrio frisius]|uniref:DNA/RNA helicase, superfamily II n=1 Tax=Thiorhodovibrio frisius TaxID=631362 RepID=H8YXV7_9GAMM|nr:DEAD/DEAH box helicase family protein [Thiorhodovibrio frisius]EIC23283.1 DNA/RNA helicase, superfamily II [Thiorhodovibrio frisius]WPL23639.1 UvsW helicase [Thiorhodovibrio frisius]